MLLAADPIQHVPPQGMGHSSWVLARRGSARGYGRYVETREGPAAGTASIDETGSTAHVGDFEAQVDRMLVNIASLFRGQGASFADVVSAATYLKRPADAVRMRQKLREAGYEGFSNAPVCRPEPLCETEALAVLPRERPAQRASGRRWLRCADGFRHRARPLRDDAFASGCGGTRCS